MDAKTRRHMSVSSRRSARSEASIGPSSRRSVRLRRSSNASTRSQAIADSNSDSDATNALSRKTSHADDSDGSGTDESLGETEEDVWFRDDLHEGDINVEELDQLLNLSEDEIQLPRIVVSSEPAKVQENPKSFVLSRQPQFVKYTPAIADETQGFSELVNEESSSDSKEKEQSTNTTDIPQLIATPSNPPIETQHTSPLGNNNETHIGESQRFSFYSAGMETTIHAPDLASLVNEKDSFSSLFNPKNGTWFLDCFRPTPVEMRALSRAFGIHPLTSEDIQTEEAREKFEKFSNYYLLVYHTFEADDADNEKFIEPINFYILVFSEGVISFHFEPVSHCRTVRRRMRQLRDHLAFTSDWVAYALIDDITDSFAPQITFVEKEADFVEDAVYLDRNSTGNTHTLLKRLGEGRRMTMHLLRMLSSKPDVVRAFAKRCQEVHSTAGNEMALYLGDIQDHVVTMYQNLSAYEKIFSRTHFNYMGLLQMEFVDSSNQMTAVLGKVTVLGTVLVPMNLVTGLFGMNVKIPGQGGENLHWFFGILGVMLFVVTILLVSGAYYVKWSTRK